MTVDLSQLLVLGIVSAGLHWLIARSEIARPFWSRMGGKIGELLRCAGCSGWWIGTALGIAGLRPLVLHWEGTAIILSGVLATVLTPIFEAVMLWGLRETAIQDDGAVEDSSEAVTDRPSA